MRFTKIAITIRPILPSFKLFVSEKPKLQKIKLLLSLGDIHDAKPVQPTCAWPSDCASHVCSIEEWRSTRVRQTEECAAEVWYTKHEGFIIYRLANSAEVSSMSSVKTNWSIYCRWHCWLPVSVNTGRCSRQNPDSGCPHNKWISGYQSSGLALATSG